MYATFLSCRALLSLNSTDRHGHRHRLPRRLPREVPRSEVGGWYNYCLYIQGWMNRVVRYGRRVVLRRDSTTSQWTSTTPCGTWVSSRRSLSTSNTSADTPYSTQHPSAFTVYSSSTVCTLTSLNNYKHIDMHTHAASTLRNPVTLTFDLLFSAPTHAEVLPLSK